MGAHLEKVGQGWRRVRPYLLGFLVVLVVAGAILALYFIPKMQVSVCPTEKEAQAAKLCFDMENEARRTLYYIMGGVLAIIGIVLTFRRIRALERQVLVAQEGQITERFTRAIEQLGSDKMEVRLGGIYALERIANDSDKDYWTIMETLTAYVRERAPWREPAADFSKPQREIEPATDIQAVLTVLCRRKYHYGQGENQRLDLRKTDLRGAYLISANFELAMLSGAHLEGAILSKANLKMAELIEAHLEGALLFKTHLEGAVLVKSNLERAILSYAHLEGAALSMANLKGAQLNGARMEWTNLRATQLEGANLSDATGLTREEFEMDDPLIDEKTRLPDFSKEQPGKESGPEGNDEE